MTYPTGLRERKTPPPELGPALRAARTRAGLGLREAARLMGIGHEYLLRLEAGQRMPSRSVAAKIADALGLDDAERAQLLAIALEGAGRDSAKRANPGSPLRTRAVAHGHRSDS